MQIALVNPQIPQNTGAIARTCAATKCPLHIVGKPNFEISDKTVRRAGLDYWPYVTMITHESWQDFLTYCSTDFPDSKLYLFSKFGRTLYFNAQYQKNDFLVFGSETKGLGPEIINSFPQSQVLTLPMFEPAVRSLNLSNTVTAALYEGIRQNYSSHLN